MPFTTAYAFDRTTGEYLGETRAFADPLHEGEYLTPAGATLTAPPAAGGNQAAVFANSAWSLVVDHRAETWYQPDGSLAPKLTLGQAPDPSWTAAPPPPTLAEVQAAKKAAVDALLLQKVEGGFVYAPLSATFDMGPDRYGRWAVDNVTAIAAGIANGQGLPASVTSPGYWDAANAPHPFTSAEFITFATAMRDHFAALLATARGLKDQVAAATTTAAVDAIDVTAGWPG